MGDRANCFIQQTQDENGEWQGIGIYAHWAGKDLHTTVLEVLPLASGRIGDESYFARIVIHNTLLRLADPDSETGFGLWTAHPDDNEHPILVVNALTGKHWYGDDYKSDEKGA